MTKCLLQSTLNTIHEEDNTIAHAITLDRVRTAALSDNSYVALSNLVKHGFPRTEDSLPEDICLFWKFRNDLSIFDGVCVYDGRVVILQLLRKEIVDFLHSAQQGVAGMKARAARKCVLARLKCSHIFTESPMSLLQ